MFSHHAVKASSWNFVTIFVPWIYSLWFFSSSLNRPTGPISSSSPDVRPSPFYVLLQGEQRRSQGSNVASPWLSNHLIRSWPLIGCPPSPPPTMGHFRESSYAYLLFKHCTILTTITSTTLIHKGKTTTATINAKKKHLSFVLACYMQRVRYCHL